MCYSNTTNDVLFFFSFSLSLFCISLAIFANDYCFVCVVLRIFSYMEMLFDCFPNCAEIIVKLSQFTKVFAMRWRLHTMQLFSKHSFCWWAFFFPSLCLRLFSFKLRTKPCLLHMNDDVYCISSWIRFNDVLMLQFLLCFFEWILAPSFPSLEFALNLRHTFHFTEWFQLIVGVRIVSKALAHRIWNWMGYVREGWW